MATHYCTLAKKYDPDKHDVIGWVVSEKLDGVRALWRPEEQRFVSRSNKPLNVPQSWLDMMEDVNAELDGEFWMGRGRFQETVSAVRKKSPTEEDFAEVQYVVFDAITSGSHTYRLSYAQAAVDFHRLEPKVVILPHGPIQSLEQLGEFYSGILLGRGEGVILRNPSVGYEMKRTGHLLKWKDEIDGLADVISVVEGTGKYVGMMGALVCVDKGEKAVSFKVGTGFTDVERHEWWSWYLAYLGLNRPDVVIRWRAMERTRDGVPRHPAFICIDKGD